MGITAVPSSLATIAVWEIRRTLAARSRSLLPVTIVMVVILIAVTAIAAERGFHLTDGIYLAGTDDPEIAELIARDPRFDLICGDRDLLREYLADLDIVIIDGKVEAAPTERGRSALITLYHDYERLRTIAYLQEPDLYAAYPVWVRLEYMTAEIAPATPGETGTEERPAAAAGEGIVPTPPATPAVPAEELRELVRSGAGQTEPVQRFTSILRSDGMGEYQIPGQIAPQLPFDSLTLIFVFIFPLYFVSQFFMMSIMEERIGRRGECLLASPLTPGIIVAGKALPYTGMMLAISLILMLMTGVPQVSLAALFPVILFFLGGALLIGMISRSFRELSFLSILFSTVATAYLFLPGVFAGIHAISLTSPITLIILAIQGDGFTAGEYLFSTVPLYLASGVMWALGIINFTDERLFSFGPFMQRTTDFISGLISNRHPYISLAMLGALSIPFVAIIQLTVLSFLFTLPLRISIPILILLSALIEELAKSAGIIALYRIRPGFFTLPAVLASAVAVGAGFLAGEKLLLLISLAQIRGSIYAGVLFLSSVALVLPFLLHITCVAIVALLLHYAGPRATGAGILAATALHSLYNLTVISGVYG